MTAINNSWKGCHPGKGVLSPLGCSCSWHSALPNPAHPAVTRATHHRGSSHSQSPQGGQPPLFKPSPRFFLCSPASGRTGRGVWCCVCAYQVSAEQLELCCTRRSNHRYFSSLVFMFPTPAAARQSVSVTVVATTAAPGQANSSPRGFGAVCSHPTAANR